jgi:hypothetical protein
VEIIDPAIRRVHVAGAIEQLRSPASIRHANEDVAMQIFAEIIDRVAGEVIEIAFHHAVIAESH